MTTARTIALTLAVSLAAVLASAQEAALLQPIERLPLNVSQNFAPHDESSSLMAARASLLAAPDNASVLVAPASRPQVLPEHKFWDRQQKLGFAVDSAVRLADTIKTCRELADGGREVWIPTQSCAGIAAWNAGSVGLTLGIGWLFHRYGFHRLERLTPWVGASASAAGLTKSVFNIH